MVLLAETIMWLFVVDQLVLAHYYIIEYKKRSPRHISFFIGLVIIAAAASIGIFAYWVPQLVNMVYLGLLYNVVFNLKLNIYRKKPLLYLGDPSNPKEHSIIDRIERSMKNPGNTLGMKIVAIISCIFILLDL